MEIKLKMNKDFERSFDAIDSKYGEDFEILNGFHESQLNFSDFIDGFVDKNVADATIDGNANAHHKDICSLNGEKGKSEDKLFAFNKIFYEIKKKYGLRTAKEWLETEYNGGFYLHDAPSSTFKPYCFSGDTKILTKEGTKSLKGLVDKDIEVLNKNHKWEKATVKDFGEQELSLLTLERHGVIKNFKVTPNHIWFVIDNDSISEITTSELQSGMQIPCNSESAEDEDPWIVSRVTELGVIEEVYCAVADTTQSFTLDGNVLTHNCYAYDLSELAKRGLFFLDEYNSQPPKHLTTFLDDVIEFVSFMSNRSSGACGLPNVLVWTCYFWKKDCDAGYYLKDPDYYIRQAFQKFIYRMNQPFLRVDQSAFVNVSIFDRNYYESLFGGLVFPDGSLAIDYEDEFMEHQKIFMEVVSDIRSQNMFTFPVLTYSLLKRTNITDVEKSEMIKSHNWNIFVDNDFARWCSDHNTKWNDSNFFMSDNVTTLSNCCFDGKQKVLVKLPTGVLNCTFKELYDMPYDISKKNLTIFHNGSWMLGKIVKLPKRKMYKIITTNKKEMYVTDNHIFPTLDGDKEVKNLSTDDYIMFNTNRLDTFPEKDEKLTYEQGFLIGMYLGDGSIYEKCATYKPTINLSLNKQKYDTSKELIDKAIHEIDDQAMFVLHAQYNNVYPTVISSFKVKDFIRKYVTGNYCYDKQLNLDCLLQSYEFRRGILDGYYETDGGNSNRIYTTSEKLVEEIECLITSLGLNSVIDVTDRRNEPVIIRDQTFKRNFKLYCIRWYNSMNKRSLRKIFKIKNNSTYFRIASIEDHTTDDDFVYCFQMNNVEEPYFTLPNGAITHNCRLLSDTSKLSGFINSIGGTALSIGSVKVNTINLMRITYETNCDEKKYLALLKKRTVLCCKTLDIIRHIIARNVEKGLLPNYCTGGIEMSKQYCTIGILGLYEVIEKFGYINTDEFGNASYSEDGMRFAKEIFKVLNEVKDEFSADKDYSFNIESVPAERAAVILCQKDNLLYENKDKFIYSNQWIPLSSKCTIQEKLRVSAILDNLCSGGAIAHINLEQNFPNKDTAWGMLNQIALTGVIYFAFNTRINACKNNHGFVGTDICPVCGEPVADTYQRIVGFFEPTRTYSKDRQREFSTRRWYSYAQLKGDI